jgi:hypothetical protein
MNVAYEVVQRLGRVGKLSHEVHQMFVVQTQVGESRPEFFAVPALLSQTNRPVG